MSSCSLALIKRTGVIDADKPISTQVRVLTLSEDSPYETLHSFISNAVSPFFKSYIRESGKADRYCFKKMQLPHILDWALSKKRNKGKIIN